MKVIIFPKYGSPDVLQFTELEKKTPKDNQILVKVYAASANPVDWHRMRAEPFLVRLGDGFRKPKNPRLGADLAGRVEAIGPDVTQFKPGDEVYGCVTGAFSEYLTARETAFALKPTNLSFEEAAAVPVAAFTALQGLRDTGKIQAGQKVLVNGASGGVGTFAVQLAKYFGASEVTGVCSTRNLDMVRRIGADHVIDYTKTDFTRNGQQYDLIYDAVGNHLAFAYKRALKPGGIYVGAGFTSLPLLFGNMLLGALISKTSDKTVTGMGIAKPNQPDLIFMKEAIEAGKVKPVIDRCYPFSETAEAIRYLETMRARGKVVITIAQSS